MAAAISHNTTFKTEGDDEKSDPESDPETHDPTTTESDDSARAYGGRNYRHSPIQMKQGVWFGEVS